jgi:hypothetical protein
MSLPPPAFTVGTGHTFRISASAAAGRDSFFTCPMGLSLQSRQAAQSLQPDDPSRWRRAWDDASKLHFALRDSYGRLVAGDPAAEIVNDEPTLTHAQRRFLRHALDQLDDLLSDASDAAGVQFELAEDINTDTPVDELRGNVTVFARHLRSIDGQVHEAVRMMLKPLRPSRTDADDDWTAIAALTLAYSAGVPANARLRISEFSLADGDLRCVFDGTRQQAAALYSERGRPLRPALNGSVFRPGAACSGCGFLNVCPAVRQLRGVLGIPGRAVATRHLTAADLHAYERCPTAFLAQRRDHLPDGYAHNADPDTSQAARDRGTAVHAWLQWAHSRLPAQPCTQAELPNPDDPAAETAAGAAGLTLDDYRTAHPYLSQHVSHCNLGFEGLTSWVTERRMVVFDPDADIVVISTPDLIGEIADSGEPIWRETKTSVVAPPDVIAAMHRYPGFALNIALLAADVPARYTNAHAELEILTPSSSEVFYASSSDGGLVTYAQRLVADIARHFAADLTFERKPSGACANCSVHEWCDPPSTAAHLAADVPAIDDAEFADFADPF